MAALLYFFNCLYMNRFISSRIKLFLFHPDHSFYYFPSSQQKLHFPFSISIKAIPPSTAMSNIKMDTAPFPENEKIINDLSNSMLSHLTTTPFACSGHVSIPSSQPVQFRFKGCGESLVFPVPAESEEQQRLFETLLNSMTPASFGRGTEEVFDEEYRRALKLDVVDFLTSFCPFEVGIVDVVRRMLVPCDRKGEVRTVSRVHLSLVKIVVSFDC